MNSWKSLLFKKPKTPEISDLLHRAKFLESYEKYWESLHFYKLALELLNTRLFQAQDERIQRYFCERIHKCFERMDKVQHKIAKHGPGFLYIEEIVIEENSTGHSYENVFGQFLNDETTWVEITDSDIKLPFQLTNLVRFCELLVKRCSSLKTIRLITCWDNNLQIQIDQATFFDMLEDSLLNFDIALIIEFPKEIRFKGIMFTNAHFIQIDRGLSFYKPPENQFSIGNNDLNLRKCLRTNIRIEYL